MWSDDYFCDDVLMTMRNCLSWISFHLCLSVRYVMSCDDGGDQFCDVLSVLIRCWTKMKLISSVLVVMVHRGCLKLPDCRVWAAILSKRKIKS